MSSKVPVLFVRDIRQLEKIVRPLERSETALFVIDECEDELVIVFKQTGAILRVTLESGDTKRDVREWEKWVNKNDYFPRACLKYLFP